MSQTICIPVHEHLDPLVAIEFATTGYPDAAVELVECSASERVTGAAVAADGSGAGHSELPPDASDAFAALTHEATSTHGTDLETATASGPFGQATVGHAMVTGADMIVVGVERARMQANPEIRDGIDHIRSAATMPCSIVHT